MLSAKIKRELKQQAHHLHPVIIIGQHGLTPAVIAETEHALKTHELIKVKINNHEREERAQMSAELRAATQAELVQSIGNIAILYRANPEQHPKSTTKKRSGLTQTRDKSKR